MNKAMRTSVSAINCRAEGAALLRYVYDRTAGNRSAGDFLTTYSRRLWPMSSALWANIDSLIVDIIMSIVIPRGYQYHSKPYDKVERRWFQLFGKRNYRGTKKIKPQHIFTWWPLLHEECLSTINLLELILNKADLNASPIFIFNCYTSFI